MQAPVAAWSMDASSHGGMVTDISLFDYFLYEVCCLNLLFGIVQVILLIGKIVFINNLYF